MQQLPSAEEEAQGKPHLQLALKTSHPAKGASEVGQVGGLYQQTHPVGPTPELWVVVPAATTKQGYHGAGGGEGWQ